MFPTCGGGSVLSGCDNLCNSTAVEDCAGICGGDNSTCLDCCGVPNGDGTSCDGECGPCNDEIDEGACDCAGNVEDCAGVCNGTSALDDCGVCGGNGSSCDVYVEASISTTVDESVLDDQESFEEDFESYIETQLGLPDGTVEVTDIIVSSESRNNIEILVEFTITLNHTKHKRSV